MVKTILTALIMSSSLIGYSQEDQVALVNKIGESPLTSYVIKYDEPSKKYSYEGLQSGDFDKLSLSEFDGFKVVNMSITYESGKTETNSYYSDEEVFPVTFVKGQKRGNAEQAERLKIIESTPEDRVVVLNSWIYKLKWNSRTDWVITNVYGAYELTGMVMMKEVFKAPKKMAAANHYETLKAYFEKAFAKQDELLPAWEKANAEKMKRRKDNPQILREEINARNSEYWASAEGQAAKKRMSNSNNSNSDSKVELVYKGSGVVMFGYEGNSSGGVHGAGQSTKLDCKKDIYIYRNESGSYKRAEKVNNGGSNCGGSIEVN